VQALRDAVGLCSSLGHQLEESHPPIDPRSLTRAYLTMLVVSTANDLLQFGKLVGRPPAFADIEPGTWMTSQIGLRKSALELEAAFDTVHAAHRAYAAWAQSYDALLTPVLAMPPLPIGTLAPKKGELALIQAMRVLPLASLFDKVFERVADTAFDFAGFTAVANLFGLPAMSVPLYWSGDLPIGVQLMGRSNGEGPLFQLAGQLERARPWAERRPKAYAPKSA
jgi:amidase